MSRFAKAFKRGDQWAARRQDLERQGAFTARHLRLKLGLLEGAIAAHRIGRVDDEHLAGLMRDWLIIREELEEQ